MKLKKKNMNRVVKTHSRAKRTFIHHLMKAQYAVISESYLEFYGNILLDMEKTTKSLNTQPITNSIPFDEVEKDVTPDTLLLNTSDKYELIEWKYQAAYQDNKDHYDHIKKYYESTGLVTYKVLTDAFVWQQPRLKNSLAIHRIAMSCQPMVADARLIRDYMGTHIITLGEIKNKVNKSSYLKQAFWWLVGRQFIDINRDTEFSDSTTLTWSDDYEF